MEPQSRSLKLDDLSKDTPNVPRSFLDRFSDKLLAIITPKEVTELYEVQRVGSGLSSGVPASTPLDSGLEIDRSGSQRVKTRNPGNICKACPPGWFRFFISKGHGNPTELQERYSRILLPRGNT